MPLSSGNPLRWNCNDRGCFNLKKRPKLERFASCFERGINFGDVDMIVETNGRFLLIEWKPSAIALGCGQRRLHDALLRIPAFTIIVVHGDAETMEVKSFAVRRGRGRRNVIGSMDVLKRRIAAWFAWAERQAAG